MQTNLVPMTISHFEEIEPILSTEFDDFWNSSILKQELENPNSHYFVAIHNNSIVGFAGIWKAVDEYHITDIVVRKDLRCKGIGSHLLEKLIETAKLEKVVSVTLEVNINNVPAKKLYEKYGFQPLGIRKKYYNQTDDAVIMTLFLN